MKPSAALFHSNIALSLAFSYMYRFHLPSIQSDHRIFFRLPFQPPCRQPYRRYTYHTYSRFDNTIFLLFSTSFFCVTACRIDRKKHIFFILPFPAVAMFFYLPFFPLWHLPLRNAATYGKIFFHNLLYDGRRRYRQNTVRFNDKLYVESNMFRHAGGG